MNTDWLKGSLLLAATLSVGIAIGIWHERSHSKPVTTVVTQSDATGAAQLHVMQMLSHALNLDSTQTNAIMETLRRHQGQVDSAWGAMRPHMNATLESTHTEIMNHLRPEQREAFEAMVRHAHGGAHKR